MAQIHGFLKFHDRCWKKAYPSQNPEQIRAFPPCSEQAKREKTSSDFLSMAVEGCRSFELQAMPLPSLWHQNNF